MTSWTPEAEWSAWARLGTLPLLSLGLDHRSRVVVLAAHPDDEVLGAGGLLRRVAASGAHLTVVWATDGEAAVPAAAEADRRALAIVRRTEASAALQLLQVEPMRTCWLGLPDGRLTQLSLRLEDLLRPVVAGADLVLATWRGDGHPDHDALGRAAARTVPAERLLEYPVWGWHQRRVEDPDWRWARATMLPLAPADIRSKQRAIAAHVSQVEPTPGRRPVLSAEFLAHFARGAEVFLGVC